MGEKVVVVGDPTNCTAVCPVWMTRRSPLPLPPRLFFACERLVVNPPALAEDCPRLRVNEVRMESSLAPLRQKKEKKNSQRISDSA